MRALRTLVGLITLAYAAWTIFIGAVGLMGMMGPLPAKLVAMLSPYLLPATAPWWQSALTLVAGLAYGVAATQLMSEPRGSWRAFLLAALIDIASRWTPTLLGGFGAAKALVMRDKVELAVMLVGLIAYFALSQVRKKRVAPAVLMG